MTAAELLARLAQRPAKFLELPIPGGHSSRAQLRLAYGYVCHHRERAEFDRALLLDAVEFSRRCTEQACAENSMCAMRCSADHVLDTIVTELRRAP